MANFKYEIDEDNIVRLWDLDRPNENDAPVLIQPYNQDGKEWKSKKEATEWVESHLAFLAEEEKRQEEERLLKEQDQQNLGEVVQQTI